EPLAAPAELAEEAVKLAGELDLGDAGRAAWLRAQLLGCETTARRLAGDPIGWTEEGERCYGGRPEPGPEERFAAAQERLDAALPGDAPLRDRYQTWVESQVVPSETLLPATQAFSRELRARTEELFGLPDDESVAYEEVANEPWTAFNYYLGGRRSRVAPNIHRPGGAVFLPVLVAHEAYPRTPTQQGWEEAALAAEEGDGEQNKSPISTPTAR